MSNDPLPERDPTKTNAQQGLYGKFHIERTDGSSAPGGKHHGCDYFVLDVTHDKHAKEALAAYADAAEATHPQLAADMRARWALHSQAEEEVIAAARAALLWVLWHHQGGSSPVGQPLRFALGMGQHEPLNDHQVAEAKRWADRTGSKTEEFHRGQAQPAGGVALPVVETWRERVKHLDRPTDFAERCAAVEEARDLRWALQDAYARIASMRTEWGAEVAALTAQARHAEAEAAKLERRAIEFGDALHRNILAMRAALADSYKHGPHHGMHWIVNTLAGPGQLPDADDVALGGQALFDREVAEHEAFRAANPGPVAAPAAPAQRDAAAMLAEHMVHVGNLEQAASAARQFQTGTVPNPIEALRAARDAVEASAKRMLGIL